MLLTPDDCRQAFSRGTTDALRAAFERIAHCERHAAELEFALQRVCEESRTRGYKGEQIVVGLREAWQGVERPRRLLEANWEYIYHRIVGECLTMYFDAR